MAANLGKKHYQDKAKKEIKQNLCKLGYKDMHCKQGRLLDNSHGLHRIPVLGQQLGHQESQAQVK